MVTSGCAPRNAESWVGGWSDSSDGVSTARVDHPAGDHGLDDHTHLVVAPTHRSVGGHGDDHRVDAAGQVRSAGGAVVVGGVVKRLNRGAHRAGQVRRGVVALFECGPGERRPGADRVVVVLLVPAAGDVVGEDAATTGGTVVDCSVPHAVLLDAGEQR